MMGTYMSGYGLLRADEAALVRAASDLECADILEELMELGYQVGERHGDLAEIEFEYGKVTDEDGFLAKLAPYVEPGSWFVWRSWDDDWRFVEDFGHPESIAQCYTSEGFDVQANGTWVETSLNSSSRLKVAAAQPLDGEALFALELTLPTGEGASWEGGASALLELLKADA